MDEVSANLRKIDLRYTHQPGISVHLKLATLLNRKLIPESSKLPRNFPLKPRFVLLVWQVLRISVTSTPDPSRLETTSAPEIRWRKALVHESLDRYTLAP